MGNHNSTRRLAEGSKAPAQQVLEQQGRLLDLAQDAIMIRDFDGTIIYWNEGAAKKYGWSKEEAIGKITHQLLQTVHPEPLENIQRKQLAEGYWEGELVHTRRDGKRITVFSRQILDGTKPGVPRVVMEINRNITELKEAERKLRESEESLRELSRHLLQSQDEERWRISRDLHDNTSQSLIGILARLHIVSKATYALDQPARKALAESLKLAEDVASFIRTFSSGLHPAILDKRGLGEAIVWYAKGIEAQTNLRVGIESPPELPRLPQEAERSLFRIVQESITRIRVNFKSPVVDIRLALTPGQLVLEVRGEGRGMKGAAGTGSEAGIRGLDVGATAMLERMRQLGGKLEICPSRTGIVIRALLPLRGAPAAASASSA
jgi:PAS domain S-box-containing protein